jgi:hypothetical protein
MIYSSRKVIKNEYFDNRNGDGFYDCDVWLQTANNIYPYLKQGMTVYYEIVGYTENGQAIQKDYDYSCNIGENKTYIYRITYTGNDGNVYEFSAKQVQDWCKNNGFLAVPEYYYGYAKEFI